MAASLALIACLAGPPAPARSPPAPEPAGDVDVRRQIGARFIGDWSEELRAEVTADLQAELELDGLELVVLTGDEPTGPTMLASIELRSEPTEAFVIEVRVRDDVTHKRLARDVDLSATPASGWSLGLAISAVELLEASWAELALEPRPMQRETSEVGGASEVGQASEVGEVGEARTPSRASEPHPEPVVRALEARGVELPDAAAEPHVRHALRVEAFGRPTTGGVALVGGGGHYTFWPVERFGLGGGLEGAGLVAPPLDAGRLRGGALSASVSLVGGLVRRPRFHLDVDATMGAGVVLSRGIGAGSLRSTNPVVDLSTALRPAVRVGPTWLYARVGVGAVLLGIDFLGADGVETRFGGVAVAAAVGVRVPLGH